MGKIWKHILIISAIAVFITLMGFLIFYPVPSPPVREVEHARASISMAAKDRADTYSGELFKEAKRYYDSAMVNWHTENEEFIYARDYTKVRYFAGVAARKAMEASEDSKTNASNLNIRIREKLKTLRTLVTAINRRFTNYPLTSEVRNRISKGKFLLTESQIDWENEQYLEADKKLTESECLLTASFEYANANLRSYFRSYPEWKKWIDSAIAVSRETRDYSIIIDKYSRKVYVYLNGIKQYEYSAELGKNWVGDKRVRGDKATPEGMYKIAKKFDRDSTRYYKALLLDYPNDEDTAKFEAAKAKGILPKSANIGDMIEIHGNGGKGADWTSGCIALTDREMDSIFKIAKIGTPVTIVGSMYDLRRILNR